MKKQQSNAIRFLVMAAVALLLVPSAAEARTAPTKSPAPEIDSDLALRAELSLGNARVVGSAGLDEKLGLPDATGRRLAQGYPGQPAQPAQPYYPPHRPRRYVSQSPRRGLMMAGWIMFGVNWIISIVVGAAILDISDAGLCSNSGNCDRLGYLLMVPVVGPFVAMIDAEDSATSRVGLLMLGLPQLAGVLMGIIGTVQHVADKRRIRGGHRAGMSLGGDWRLMAGVAPGAYGPAGTVQLSTLID